MEEKERYEIHIYDDICVDLYDNGVLDKSINDTYKLEELLNQQSKRIKELEEELDDAKRDYIPKLEFGLQRANKMGRDAEKENQQLKQQIADLEAKLAEKDKEIEKLNACVDFYKSYYVGFQEKVIDELAKVKENIKKVPITDFDLSGNFEKMYKQDAIRQIDNQIKQLKEGK